jgi:hypothetical protein
MPSRTHNFQVFKMLPPEQPLSVFLHSSQHDNMSSADRCTLILPFDSMHILSLITEAEAKAYTSLTKLCEMFVKYYPRATGAIALMFDGVYYVFAKRPLASCVEEVWDCIEVATAVMHGRNVLVRIHP